MASGERVTLRTAEPEDAPFLQRAWANPRIRYPQHGGEIRNQDAVEEDFERHFSEDGDELLLVCLDDDDAGPGAPSDDGTHPIGMVRAGGPDWARSELAFFIVPEVQGEGYGREAVALVIDYLFRTDSHPAIWAQTFAHNDASRGLLESLGFTQEGCARKAIFVDGKYRDLTQYGLLREEWHDQD